MTHVPWGAYENAAQARGCDRRASRYVQSLNGTWKFKLFQNPVAAPKFFAAHFDAHAWQDIPVPSDWQRHLQETPDSAPEPTALPVDPPLTPGQNPTGCYRTTFTLPETWRERQVFVVFESVYAAFHLWVNGQELGFSTDSRLPAEFDITPHLLPGVNTLAARVPQIAASAYLEDCGEGPQRSGILGDVYLIAKPRTHLRDFTVRTLFGPDYHDATLELHVFASSFPRGERWSVSAELFDPEGSPVFKTPLSQCFDDHALPRNCARLTATVPRPRHWTAETPDLYTLTLTLRTPDTLAVDYESCRVGFRQVERRNGDLLLNGRPLVLLGMDRRDVRPDTGAALPTPEMRAEAALAKRLNFNAIRTRHHPLDTRWYDLCDELGLYVIDEANVEDGAPWCALLRDPAWAGACLERATRMVLRDRNHPCVIAWSLGQDTLPDAPHAAAMAAWVRAFDPTRPAGLEPHRPAGNALPRFPVNEWSQPAPAPVSIEQIALKETRAGRFRINNRYLFSDLSHLDLEWSMQANGADLQSGRMALPDMAPSQDSVILTVPFKTPAALPGVEYFLNLRCVLNRDFPWAGKGHAVAVRQLKLPLDVPDDGIVHPPATRERIKSACGMVRTGFDPVAGTLVSLRVGDLELLARGLQDFFHGMTADSAGPEELIRTVKSCQVLHVHEQIGRSESEEIGLRMIFDTASAAPSGTLYFQTRTAYEFINGVLSVHVDVTTAESLDPLSCAGLELALTPGLDRVAWFGRGPAGSGTDPACAPMIGLHRATVAGLRAVAAGSAPHETRWVALAHPDGAGLRIRAIHPFFGFFIAAGARHDGTANSPGPAARDAIVLRLAVRPDCQTHPRRFRFGFMFEPLAPGADPCADAASLPATGRD